MRVSLRVMLTLFGWYVSMKPEHILVKVDLVVIHTPHDVRNVVISLLLYLYFSHLSNDLRQCRSETYSAREYSALVMSPELPSSSLRMSIRAK
jgi:hypothetical protein